MEFVTFHRTGLAEIRRLLRGIALADRLAVMSDMRLLNEFGEGYVALFEVEPDIVELVVDRVDPPVAVVLWRSSNGTLQAVAAYQREGDARQLAIQRARERSTGGG